jgi:hypothetical protein
MTADRIELPDEAVLRLGLVSPGEDPIHQPGDQICPQRQPRGYLPLPQVLRPCALQERCVRQDVRRRLGLTEELLRREQGASFRDEG